MRLGMVDLVTISQADWNPTTKELTVAAKSSMFQDGSSTNPALVIQPEIVGKVIGNSPVDAAGVYSIRTTGTVPASLQKVLIKSAKGASLGMTPTVRN